MAPATDDHQPLEESTSAPVYRDRDARFASRLAELRRQSDRLARNRLIAFLAAVAALIAGGSTEALAVVWLVVAGALLVGFVVLVVRHRRVLHEVRRLEALVAINRESLGRVERRWEAVPLVEARASGTEAAVARDLDLLGEASLFHLLCRATTPAGVETLRDWLLHPAEPGEVQNRQEAVAELAPQLELRQELELRGRLNEAAKRDPRAFLAWAEGPLWLARRTWLRWAAQVLPMVSLGLLVLVISGTLPFSLWLLMLVVHFAISLKYAPKMHAVFNRVSSRHGGIQDYGELFALMADMPVGASESRELHDVVSSDHRGAHGELLLLGRIMDLADVRFSQMVYLVFQGLTLWDFHVMALLERWQRRCGSHVRQWFSALGRWEALCSLAGLAHDQPDWGFPNVEPEAQRVLEAEGLGHPLLADRVRVANDVAVGPPGTFLLVTGSNMSGKSTLLRALGTNAVLAQAGGPVCARRLRMPPLVVATSMRIEDSLAAGVSYFLAELKRLKEIVDLAHQSAAVSNPNLLYLLDEVLQGTNTAERQIAVRRVLAHLIESGAIGAVSTHDLQVAAVSPLKEACRAVHFREQIAGEPGRRQMTFDYKLRPGVATSTNALKLLEMVGLETTP